MTPSPLLARSKEASGLAATVVLHQVKVSASHIQSFIESIPRCTGYTEDAIAATWKRERFLAKAHSSLCCVVHQVGQVVRVLFRIRPLGPSPEIGITTLEALLRTSTRARARATDLHLFRNFVRSDIGGRARVELVRARQQSFVTFEPQLARAASVEPPTNGGRCESSQLGPPLARAGCRNALVSGPEDVQIEHVLVSECCP